jgi:hypothetical protein
MVGMFVSLCLASQKPSEREFFVTAGADLGVKLLTLFNCAPQAEHIMFATTIYVSIIKIFPVGTSYWIADVLIKALVQNNLVHQDLVCAVNSSPT